MPSIGGVRKHSFGSLCMGRHDETSARDSRI